MADTPGPVVALTDSQCWERLRSQELGRLVTRVGDVLDIFPVNFVADGESILFRTAEGSKLFELTVNDEVLFEVDDHTDTDAWSVIVRGHAHALDDSAEVERADGLGLRPWIPTLKYTYVRIEPASLSGRAFERGPEPDRYGVQQY
ncbi:pyridoxamine 5'-phosphate oxidase family protein [Microbacterium sulfonylureivorans]|uniref:pyridoxamine 5'-phosphate oxidase family protein n=1 Tax=Microbacterium sulfonylureivorans TaxID=2486854 RepID=UPI000FD710F2|nr:pyridoxamine 5'-phosphate oxidase family protein [Microbacterium sulfonylureivorans]